VHRFLEWYQEARTPKLPARQFRELVVTRFAEALLSADVLTRGAVATTYPCRQAHVLPLKHAKKELEGFLDCGLSL